MGKYWFKPKSYGYGFCPISLEGWLATLGLILLVLLSAKINNFFVEPGPNSDQVVRFVIDAILIATISCLLFEKKMKEPLQWRWGRKKKR